MIQYAPLKDVAKIERKGIAPENIEAGENFVGLENINGEGNFVGVRQVMPGEIASTKFHFTGEHVLYGKLRPYLRKIARPDFSGVCSTDIIPIRPGKDLDKSYLYHFLRQPDMIELAVTRCSGANLPRLSPKELEKFSIPLPPLEEQKRISAILDKADAIRRKRQQAIDLTDQLLRSVFLDMFGDPVTNPKGWDKKPLHRYAKKITVGHVGPTSDYYTDSGVPFLRTQNVRRLFVNRNDMMQVTEAFHAKLKKSTLKADDVLVSRVGANRGMSCVVPEDLDGANCANILLATLNEKYDPYFLSYLINSEYGQRTLLGDSVGSAQGVINTAKLKDWLVYDIPVDLQKKFRNATMRLFEQKKKYKNSLELMNDNFASLSQRAFSGELTKATKAA